MDYWRKQTDESLYPELEWNKPERRDHAGKLLIIGGDLHNLTAPAQAFAAIKATGISNIKIALPDKTKKLVGKTLPEALFLPSTVTGEFSHSGAIELLDYAVWADSLLLPGDNGRNSQTTILFADLLQAYQELAVLTRDAVDILTNDASAVLSRPRTTLIVSFAQLQKLVKQYGYTTPLVFSMNLPQLVEFLHHFSQQVKANIVTMHQNQILVAVNGAISTTKLEATNDEPEHWRLAMASQAVCYQTWNPHKSFEALTHAAHQVSRSL